MYQQEAITNVNEIPELLATFAGVVGFTASSPSAGVALLARPGDDLVWSLASPTSGALEVRYAGDDSNSAFEDSNSAFNYFSDNYCRMESPTLYQGASDVLQLPTAVHMFGALLPEPYLHVAIAYGANLFRHLYIGSVEKIGTYTRGNIVSATWGPGLINSSPSYDEFSDMKYLFQGSNDAALKQYTGGVFVDDPANAKPWRSFYGTFTNNIATFEVDTAIGGFGDSVNDGYLARSQSPFAGETILTPINMYVPQPIVGDRTFVPIGRVSGIRLVSMQNLDPASEIVVGGIRWMVFPSHSRRIEKDMVKGGAAFVTHGVTFESSYWVGYAILIAEEDSNS